MPLKPLSHQTLGVCYYPEHWPQDRWPQDARMMVEAGIEFVRIGEFAWSRLEPEPGRSDWAWLDHAFEILAEAGLKVVLGTPTATPPKWLVDAMPDMLPVGADGRVRGFGSRRHYCFSHKGYRAECARITTALAKRYGEHPALAAWQTDNEYGCHRTTLSYSRAALLGFRDWLAQQYQSIEALNRSWGNVFWSMEYRSFDEIELPVGAVTQVNPSHLIDFRRFASDEVVAFNRLQTEIIRLHSPGRAISHNFMGKFFEFDHYAVSADLDIATWDAYPLGFLDREIGDPVFMERYMGVGHPDFDAFHHDLYRTCGQMRQGTENGRWWVMEQQPPGPLNWGAFNPEPKPGAGRLWVWEAFAAGAEVVSFFRWRQPHFAQEQMHEGLLLPDGTPNHGYELCKEITADLATHTPVPVNTRSDVALVFDYDSQWMTEIMPVAEDASHFDSVFRSYCALRRAGISVDIIPPSADAISNRKLIVMPMLVHCTDAFAEALDRSEAVILAGPWTGAKTRNLAIPETLPPGPLQSLIDIALRRVETRRPFAPFKIANSEAFDGWREDIVPGESVDVIERLETGGPAVLQKGKVVYVAGRGDEKMQDKQVRRALDLAKIKWTDLPDDLRIRDNGQLSYVFNYGSKTRDITSIAKGRKLEMGSLQLEPCGVTCLGPRV
ncbi:beta-galactosidase [Ruegeria sp. HKCCD7255]|uniref:beta-galactosidase n=1 Tax=Ruegeria sp. HKCCD7255 TaxID=2683004 RepID=UPI001489D25C|nr:beta-galactosidase [Ruegeria sp. HKCCD7255]